MQIARDCRRSDNWSGKLTEFIATLIMLLSKNVSVLAIKSWKGCSSAFSKDYL